MIDPYLALFVVGTCIGAAALLLWPYSGVYWRWARILRASERVLSEDALKHLFDCEYRSVSGTVQGVSGALGVSDDRAAEVLSVLQQMQLVAPSSGEFALTEEGREQALQIVRVHRLWERHFSEDTGMGAEAWHREADRLEHRTSPEDAEAMAARLGHPRFDPHGDPIPTLTGELQPATGVPLSDLGPGTVGRVTHIEDEPDVLYRQLLAADLYVGTQIHVLASGADGVRFTADGLERSLSQVAANNLAVEPVAGEEAIDATRASLATLLPGESGTVMGISAACRGVERRRLMDLGIVPGTVVRAELQGPGGDPTAYRIRGAVIALRNRQAKRVHIVPAPEASE